MSKKSVPSGKEEKISLLAMMASSSGAREKNPSSCLPPGVEVYELGRKRKELTPSLTPETCRFPFLFLLFFLGKKCAAMCALEENLV